MRRLILAMTLVASPVWADSPTVILELFTSKYCPNCPAVERQLAKEAHTNPNRLLLQQHVDYWDRGPQKDPFGLAEATQRQYDYSNTLSRRAGEVFTPMPILNGRFVSPPPMFLNWVETQQKAAAAPAPLALQVTRAENGALSFTLPKGATEAVLFGVEAMETPNALRVRAIVPMDVAGNIATIGQALLPKTPEWVILAQTRGPGAVVGFARLDR